MRQLQLSMVLTLVVFSSLFGRASVQQGCIEAAGTVERQDYFAPAIDTRMYYSVYLPPCYDPDGDLLPVIYLMHGSNEDDGQWGRLGLIDELNTQISHGIWPPMIVVLPFANWIGNQNQFGPASWSAVFVDQFMPLVEGIYPIDPERRVIGGISRGGFWAVQIAFRNPEMFDAVGGHSAFFDAYHAPPNYNPLNLALDAPGIDSMRISLDRGADDYAAPGLDLMHEKLNQRGIDHMYQIYLAGQHNNTYWGSHINDYMAFYVEDWLEDNEAALAVTVTPQAHEFVTNTPHPNSFEDMGILPTTQPERSGVHISPTADPELAGDGVYLFVPAVVFPSLQVSISEARLRDLRAGILDPKLVLSTDVSEMLQSEFGLGVTPQIRTVELHDLYNTLFRDRTLYTLLPFDRLTPRYRVLLVDEQHPLDLNLSDFPFAFESNLLNFEPSRLTRIAFSGVTALTRQTIPALDREGFDWAASGIIDYVTRPDFFHTSNEVSFHPDCPAAIPGRLGGFCSKLEHFELFKLLDVDIVELSGNHNNDYGYEAYRATLNWYNENGIATIAGGETVEAAREALIVEHNGNRIALLSCNLAGPYYAWATADPAALGGVRPGAAQCQNDWLKETLGRLADENDVVVFSLQHIEFDQFTPSWQQQMDFRTFASWGADVVLGTQSHFPQIFEFAPGRTAGNESLLHYGLGNLYFDQEFFGGVRFFIDQLFIYDGRLLTVDLLPGIIEAQGRPRPMTPEERENFLFLIFTQYGGM